MAVSVSFRTYLLEQLGQIRPVTTRPMFGGLTFFADGRAFALVADEVLYFKVDDSNRPDFEAAGMGPFLPFGDPDKPMQYYELPEEVLEDPDQLAHWMVRAIAVAANAKAKPKARPRAKAKSKSKSPATPSARRR
ncbi:MAG: regulator of competence-specific s [Holophagaceae bacterium]|nr:regulator of competence-specific s [Holophagaceae bacterium]